MELTNIDIKKLPTQDFFSSVLIILQQQSLLLEEKVAQINLDIFSVLQEQIRKFTGGDSSVSKERAQSLTDSFLYVISLYLKQFPTFKIIDLLQNTSCLTLYKQGHAYIQELVVETDIEIANLQTMLLDTNLYVYNDTLKHGLSSFSSIYNFDYVAQDTVLTFDYPTYLPIRNLVGIEKMYVYIKYLQLEHSFYSCLSTFPINQILTHYQNNDLNLIFNISELLWKQLLLCTLINTELKPLHSEAIKKIYTILSNKTKKDVHHLIQKTFYLLSQSLSINTLSIIQYFEKGLPSIASQIYYGVKYKTLDKDIAIKNI
ncbi:MAG: DUF6179 domain-containing protein [Coprobacillaceae bacterium]